MVGRTTKTKKRGGPEGVCDFKGGTDEMLGVGENADREILGADPMRTATVPQPRSATAGHAAFRRI